MKPSPSTSFPPTKKNIMTKRLEVLESSLKKKEAVLDSKIEAHFDSVRQANGQPLNDKRNGAATMAKWEAQNDAIRAQAQSIDKTKQAIERERSKISNVQNQALPLCIIAALEAGQVTQWRKFPNRFFVAGVEKARIVYNEDTNTIGALYVSSIPTSEQFAIFRDAFNSLKKQLFTN